MTETVRLHDYQNDIRTRLFEAWRTCRSVMVQMPTGTGKTHVLASVVKECLTSAPSSMGEGSGGPLCNEVGGGPVWIVAHRRELVSQIEETIERYGMNGHDGHKRYESHKGHEDSEENGGHEGRIKVMSIQWLTRHIGDMTDRPQLVVIDEAHHAQARTYRMLWEWCPEARFLGLTATPCRMNRSGFTDLFDTLITSWTVAEFIRKGFLSAFDYVSIRPWSVEQRLIDSLEKRGADGDYQVTEMNRVLNRNVTIGRLYRSVAEFAGGRKGIVYAISIGHARNIAAYYNDRGLSAAAIDSRTPAAERRRLVEDFKAGRIRVLVNVDIFSEGFDCPDVEFVQMARPTLSLAKYLQQVGRGLRKTKDKETCVLIDNVGLHRLFGLPVAAWDWEAMFRGDMSGKGTHNVRPRQSENLVACPATEPLPADSEMEVIVTHDNLLEVMEAQQSVLQRAAQQRKTAGMTAWQDVSSGLWGLKRGRVQLTEARYAVVFDVRRDMAAVKFRDGSCGLVDDTGDVLWQKGRYRDMAFQKNSFLSCIAPDGVETYLDLLNLRAYPEKPSVKRYGNIELLKLGNVYYSRTKTVYMNSQGISDSFIVRHGFYLSIFDRRVPCSVDLMFSPSTKSSSSALPSADMSGTSGVRSGYACLLDGDGDSYYWLVRGLEDGTIVVKDTKRNVFHLEEGRGRTLIGDDRSEFNARLCRHEIERLAERARAKRLAVEAEKEKRRRVVMTGADSAVPFRSGLKWGLKVGGRITVPPIYRCVRPPVGRFCVVEKNYSQWGVVAIDGKVVVEPKYPEVSIGTDGMALLTSVTGKTVSVEL